MRGCSALLGAMSTQWPTARQCQRTIESLTAQTLPMFDHDAEKAQQAAQAAMTGSVISSLRSTAGPSTGVSTSERPTLPFEPNHFLDISTGLDAWLDSLGAAQPVNSVNPLDLLWDAHETENSAEPGGLTGAELDFLLWTHLADAT